MEVQSLSGKVAVVTGASRGIGRGIAVGLGKYGAKVYVTGRSYDPKDKGETTLAGTVAAINAGGGVGVGVQCDHADEVQIEALFKRVAEENEGRLDILVNNCYSAVSALFSSVDQKFWEKPVSMWDEVNVVGLRAHYHASWHAARLMTTHRSGLIVNVSSVGGMQYLFDIAYGVGKAGLDRMGRDMAHELAPLNIAVVTLWPGPVKTEFVVDKLLDGKAATGMSASAAETARAFEMFGESTLFPGEVVAHLAGRPHEENVARMGKVVMTADYADRHGLLDVGNTHVLSTRSVRFALLHAGWTRLAPFIPTWVKVPLWVLTLATQSKISPF